MCWLNHSTIHSAQCTPRLGEHTFFFCWIRWIYSDWWLSNTSISISEFGTKQNRFIIRSGKLLSASDFQLLIFLGLLFYFYFLFNGMCKSSRAHVSLVTANVHRDWWTDVEYVMPAFTLRYPEAVNGHFASYEWSTYYILTLSYQLALAVHLIHINYIDSSVSHNRHTTFRWCIDFGIASSWSSLCPYETLELKFCKWNSAIFKQNSFEIFFFHPIFSFIFCMGGIGCGVSTDKPHELNIVNEN